MKKNKIKYVDLFAGCGGLSFGFHNHPKYQHILATDIWEQAKETYQKNFKNKQKVFVGLVKIM